ncbi:MAG: holo-ACP synthase [Phototrophicaceae bacterium]|jgi:holo-[acyl-carrier protein] synthase
MLRCGIDTIDNNRIAAGLTLFGDRFRRRFFTDGELADCKDQPHRLAARIAAKEAVAKALGTGIGIVSWKEIEIRVGENGRPVLHLYGAALEVSQQLEITQWDISLTHTATLATAIAVAL